MELAEARRKRERAEEELNKLIFKVEKIDKYEQALVIMDAIHEVGKNLTTEELIIASPVFVMHINRVQSLVGDEGLKDHPDFIAFAKMLQAAANAVNQATAEHNRQERLSKRTPVPDVVQEGRKCVRCNKRPQKFGDLCGRCAEETGQREHGKV